MIDCFRFSETTLEHPDFKRRYAWYLSQFIVILIVVWGYGIFGSAFANAQPEYQWILALFNPLLREINFKLLKYVVCKTAGAGDYSGKSVEIITQHYVYCKHAIFLAVIVGGVATPTTNYCIAAMDFIEAIIDCLRIIRKYNQGLEVGGKNFKLVRKRLMSFTLNFRNCD